MKDAISVAAAVVVGIVFLVVLVRLVMWLTDRRGHLLKPARGGAEGGYEAQTAFGNDGANCGDAGGGDGGGGD